MSSASRLVRRDRERVGRDLVGGELEGDAGASDPGDSHEDLDLVVEPRGREVLDVVRAHDEVAAGVPVQHAEQAVVLDPREVEVGGVAAVVDDPLRVRVGEPDPRLRAELERRLRHGRDPSEEAERSSPVSPLRSVPFE